MKKLAALEAIGAALMLFPYYLPLLSRNNLALYHHDLPVTNLIGGLLLDLLAVAIFVFGFLFAIRHLPATIQKIVHSLFAAFMLWRIVDIAIPLLSQDSSPPWWLHVRSEICIAVLLLSATLTYFVSRIMDPAIQAVDLALTALAFSALWIVPQLIYLSFARLPFDNSALNHPSASTIHNRRIIWVLYDELSYEQTFDHPAPGLKLPNLERLRATSVSFSNLKPIGFYTERIIPSLFIGRAFNKIRSTVDGDLFYKDESDGRWIAYDPNTTLFALAQRNGWSTGVVGWYNPYCHILARVLNTCYWEPTKDLPMEAYGASEEKGAWTNAAALQNVVLAKLKSSNIIAADIHLREFNGVMKNVPGIIKDDQVNFVFLHIPAPHPSGIYERQHHLLRVGGDYLDNLVLADDTLGEILKEIDATSLGNETTVIVSSDHSWRIPLWRGAAGWTAEEERASGGRFDDRPVLLVHFPGQVESTNVDSAQSELVLHDIIAGMLTGKLTNLRALTTLLAQSTR